MKPSNLKQGGAIRGSALLTLQRHLFQEHGFCFIGAVSSREYRSFTVLLLFIATGSRCHNGK
jgi:hypothetical protein